jgi:integrase
MTHPGNIPKPRLLDQTNEAIRLRHLSPRTGKAYRYWIVQCVRFHNLQHATELLETHVRDFLSMLATTRKVSASTQNQALNVLVFLYRHVLQKPFGTFGSSLRAKRPAHLPTVLNPTEARAVIAHLREPYRRMGMLLYGCGLRLLECLTLRIKHIDLRHTLAPERVRHPPGAGTDGPQGRPNHADLYPRPRRRQTARPQSARRLTPPLKAPTGDGPTSIRAGREGAATRLPPEPARWDAEETDHARRACSSGRVVSSPGSATTVTRAEHHPAVGRTPR